MSNPLPPHLLTPESLNAIFGECTIGGTPEKRASNSTRVWVRGQDHLAICNEGATGLMMTSTEALEIFGLEKLDEALEYGTAIIVRGKTEPGTSLRARRHELDLDAHEVAERAGLTIDQVQDCESQLTRSDIHQIAAICAVLQLDARSIGFLPYRPSLPTT
jgi:hypothetical protein